MESVVFDLIALAKKVLAEKEGVNPDKDNYLREGVRILEEILGDLKDPNKDRQAMHRKFWVASMYFGAGGALGHEKR